MKYHFIIAMLIALINSVCIFPVTCAEAEDSSKLRVGFTGNVYSPEDAED